jgi:hypothetical protein
MTCQSIAGAMILAAAFAGTAGAQGQPATPPDERRSGPLAPAQPAIDTGVGMLLVEPLGMGDPVANTPYSANIVSEVLQELPDGNRIERRTTGAVARDNQGRMRREQPLMTIGPVVPPAGAHMITISDPIARMHYSLDPARKVAMRSRLRQAAGASERAARDAGPGVPGDLPSMDVRTEELGWREYEGVRAHATRTVATVPAGAIGNVRPIEIVSDRWYSPDLRVVVFSRRRDPRHGETIYRLTNITRTEPDPSLLEVPVDYRIEDVQPLR